MTACNNVPERWQRHREETQSWNETRRIWKKPRTHYFYAPSNVWASHQRVWAHVFLVEKCLKYWQLFFLWDKGIKKRCLTIHQRVLRFLDSGWASAYNSKLDFKGSVLAWASRTSASSLVHVYTRTCKSIRTECSSLLLCCNLCLASFRAGSLK